MHQPQGSCIEPGLAMLFLYDTIHVSMTLPQIIPPSPSPRVQKPVLYICVSISALNAEQIQIRKVALQNRMALDILTASKEELVPLFIPSAVHTYLI